MPDWTAPRTWVSRVESGALNVDVRDNMDWLWQHHAPVGTALAVPYKAIVGTTTFTANRCVFTRVLGYGAASGIAFRVVTKSGRVAGAIYNTTGSGRSARPNTVVASTGAVDCPEANNEEASIITFPTPLIVTPDHWIAFAVDNATAAFAVIATYVGDSALFDGLAHYQNDAFPPPATASVTAARGLSIHLGLV